MGKTDDSGGGGGGMLRRESLGHEIEGKEGENIYSFREKQKKGGVYSSVVGVTVLPLNLNILVHVVRVEASFMGAILPLNPADR